MAYNFEAQFNKLVELIEKVKRFSFGLKKQYLGPIGPSSIIIFGSDVITLRALVLAEEVPSMYLPFDFDTNHLEAVIVYLNENFEFQHYQPEINELLGLSVLIGDKNHHYDGTVAGAIDYFKNKNWKLDILYQHGKSNT